MVILKVITARCTQKNHKINEYISILNYVCRTFNQRIVQTIHYKFIPYLYPQMNVDLNNYFS